MARDKSDSGTLLANRLLMGLALLPELGLDPDAVLARAGIPRDSLTGPDDLRVPATIEHRLWQALEAEAGECSVGLRIAELYLKYGMPTLEGYLARNAATLRAVLVDMDRFAAIYDNRMRLVLLEHDDVATIRVVRALDRAQGSVELLFACMVGFTHRFVGPVPIYSCHLRRSKPRELSRYRTAFGGALPVFGKQYNEMLFPRASLELPVRGAEPALATILEAHAQQLVQNVPSDDPFLRRVRSAVEQSLEGGPVRITRVTSTLGVSERTLRRQLIARQTSYRALTDEVRCKFACKLLTEREPVHTIAERVGFRSTSAFQKAFARWMEVSPSEYRRLQSELTLTAAERS